MLGGYPHDRKAFTRSPRTKRGLFARLYAPIHSTRPGPVELWPLKHSEAAVIYLTSASHSQLLERLLHAHDSPLRLGSRP